MRLPVLVAVVLLAAGCSAEPKAPPPPPKVDFAAAEQQVSAKPYLYCDLDIKNCKQNTLAQVTLKVAPGTPVTVRVPDEVSNTPWSVVIEYRTAAGLAAEPRTVATFGPGKQNSFEATTPKADDQLQTVEVKQAGGKLVEGDEGPEAVTRAVWSARVVAP